MKVLLATRQGNDAARQFEVVINVGPLEPPLPRVHSPVSISAPHTYISTRPFLPAQSPLLAILSKRFTEGIKMQSGELV